MQHCLIIFVFAALVSILKGDSLAIDINGIEVPYKADVSDIWKVLQNQLHVMKGLANVTQMLSASTRMKEVQVTGTEIQVYVEKSRTWTNGEDKHEQIQFEPLSVPLIVAEKVKNDQNQDVDVKLTLENVRAFLRTFGIWRKVHIYKNPHANNLWKEDGIQVKSSDQLPALYILFKKL
ncbi:hypothetical protein Ddc_10358 [Ditylenchus destructor]|nr:hypothetical protein Ddc_10358 [Ditylenchus destructor]